MGRENPGITRRLVLGALMATPGVALAEAPLRSIRPEPRGGRPPAEARRPSAQEAEAIVAEAALGGRVAFAVADARTGALLEAGGAGEAMPPASVTKAITALYAVEALGPGHRFRTQLIATGPVANGRVDGDLILAGTGDPTLNTDNLAAMAARLRDVGLREVSGRFRVHGGALPYVRSIDPGQPDHVGYNPSISGLNLNFNRVHFEWRRTGGSWQVAMDARSERLRPAVTVARMRVADRRSPLYTYDDRDGVDDWTVAGPALDRDGSRWLPVRRPAEYAGEVFQVLARSYGIVLRHPEETQVAPRGTVLVEHVSDDLTAVLTDMLKWSTNITAEVVGLSASALRGGAPSSLAVSGARMSDWLRGRAGVDGARFVDHSGLGPDSRISPQDMVTALVRSGPDGLLRRMLKRVDMTDSNGRPLRDHPARVVAKTGTLNFVSGLAGYVQGPSNAVLAFAIFAADLDRRRRLSPEEMERPDGGRGWTQRARAMQQKLIERWVAVHAA
ncbi:MAG: D-alanyl-D-alanine carboxypeptidase/D-alanyl-D-alanine-endopeptidase [Rhodobacteraceae bacterium]|jgi:D-alanyl-D-alanine carboxypeptidase/D-alanyl-D-alanine-endopeptidase (penicillin-binding protein 4)|nr:D-alanyl-D-alanine carboxypeptidase/D-alanyl-D-alanine-endopeptidase [Paracoccaceae bacterium]